MPRSAFEAQLDVLAAEYAVLEDENERLKDLLCSCLSPYESWGGVADRSGDPWRRWERLGEGLEECISPSVPHRIFHQEAIHGVALGVASPPTQDADGMHPSCVPDFESTCEQPPSPQLRTGHTKSSDWDVAEVAEPPSPSPQLEPPRSASSNSNMRRVSWNSVESEVVHLPAPSTSQGSWLEAPGSGGGDQSISSSSCFDPAGSTSSITILSQGTSQQRSTSLPRKNPPPLCVHPPLPGIGKGELNIPKGLDGTGSLSSNRSSIASIESTSSALENFGIDEDDEFDANGDSEDSTLAPRAFSVTPSLSSSAGKQVIAVVPADDKKSKRRMSKEGSDRRISKEGTDGSGHSGLGAIFGRRNSRTSNTSEHTMGSTESGVSDMSMDDHIYESRTPKPMFANLEAMKATVRAQLMSAEYNVADHYHATGVFQAVARSQAFDSVSLAVIGLNAIWVAVDTDYNGEAILADAPIEFQITEYFFCTYFLLEVVIRFFAFKSKIHCFFDRWFLFDSSLVFLMVLDIWVINLFFNAIAGNGAQSAQVGNASILRMARLLRLTRMARCIRLLRAMPELLVLLKGMAAAARSVCYTLVLLMVLLYVFGIAFTQLLQKEQVGKDHFGSVLQSMHTLWLYAALLDEITTLMDQLKDAGIAIVLLMDIFIILAALMVMNMLVGVLCEVVSAVATYEKQQASLSTVRTKVERIFRELGLHKGKDHEAEDGQMKISKDEFQSIVENREAARAIQDLGVDVIQMVDMADTLFKSDDDDTEFKDLTFSEFMDAMQQMRGTNFSTVKDLVNLQKALGATLAKHSVTLGNLERRFDVMQGHRRSESISMGRGERRPSMSMGDRSKSLADLAGARRGSRVSVEPKAFDEALKEHLRNSLPGSRNSLNRSKTADA